MDPSATVERVVGRYMLCDEIAAGGMATVHFGRLLGPVGFARTVAIKRLHAHYAKDPEFVAMLLDEARLAARIRHPNVVSTLDVVVEKGELLVVMDYVQGESLSRLARAVRGAHQRIPLGVVMSIMSSALYGLHAAHDATDDRGRALGIVHRDVSPQNILVGVDGVARVLDFGVAKAAGRVQTTRDGTLKGKLAYMSPEQVVGGALDRRSDIYAASVVLWELLCNRRLFQGDNEASTLFEIASGKVTPPRAVVPDIPPEVDAVVMKGLGAKPEDRFQTALEMAEALQRIAYATPGQVAEWVAHFGARSLAERAARIAEIESSSYPDLIPTAADGITMPPPGAPAPRPPAPVVDNLSDLPTEVMPAPPASRSQITDFSGATRASSLRPGRSPWVLVTVLSVLLLGTGVALGFVLHGGASHAGAAASSAPPTAAATAPAPSASVAAPPATATAAPPATVSVAPPATVATPSATAVAALRRTPTPARSAARATHPVRTVTAPSHPRHGTCNPPYTLDKDGMRIPKPECL